MPDRTRRLFPVAALLVTICAAAPARDAARVEPPQVQVSQYIRRIFQDRRGALRFGTNGDGVCRYDGARFVFFTRRDGLGGDIVRAIVEDDAGTLWFATDGGVTRYDGKRFRNLDEQDGLADRDVWSLLRDRHGVLWVGTKSGVSRIAGGSITRFPLSRPPAPSGAPTSFPRIGPELVWSILEDRSGALWFGTDGAGLVKYDGRSQVVYSRRDGLPSDAITSILQARDGNLWLGTWDGGVSRFDGRSFTTVLSSAAAGGAAGWSLLEDHTGRRWFGTAGAGLFSYAGDSLRHYTAADGLGSQHVQSMLEERGTHRLWFGTSGGLYRLDGGRFVNVTRPR